MVFLTIIMVVLGVGVFINRYYEPNIEITKDRWLLLWYNKHITNTIVERNYLELFRI